MATDEMVVDVSQDWATACDVQERFMQIPGPAIDTVRCSGRCRQARALGGDCYDFLSLPHHRLALSVGDACGKGLAAALMISSVQSSLRTAASFAPNDAAAVLDAVNRQVHASSHSDRYATLFYGAFDGATRTLRYVNAGHNPPMIIRGGRLIAQLEPCGPPVGIFPDSTYQESVVQLSRGDLIIAYTDGVVEAVNPAGEDWGAEGLLAAVAKNEEHSPDEIVDAIFTSLDEFSRGRQTDDATVVVARVQ